MITHLNTLPIIYDYTTQHTAYHIWSDSSTHCLSYMINIWLDNTTYCLWHMIRQNKTLPMIHDEDNITSFLSYTSDNIMYWSPYSHDMITLMCWLFINSLSHFLHTILLATVNNNSDLSVDLLLMCSFLIFLMRDSLSLCFLDLQQKRFLFFLMCIVKN